MPVAVSSWRFRACATATTGGFGRPSEDYGLVVVSDTEVGMYGNFSDC
ncbi:hypothetical protein ACFY8O_02005 [Streptomyces argenteolus]|uniref:Uncharacterized protein n=1 Tax=Streptomyces argenteolus TaxID=67274 RepID=A0ABW6X0U6_9ACTN